MRTLTLTLLLMLACGLCATAQGTYTQIDYPGTVQATYARGINDAGDVSGYYEDASFSPHGFILSGGTYTSVDYPKLPFTILLGLNNLGQAVGYATKQFANTAFVYDVASQTFNIVHYPDAVSTVAYGINDSGTVVGAYKNRVDPSSGSKGFELLNGTYSKVRPPGEWTFSYALGVSAQNQVVGYAGKNTNPVSDFLFNQSSYRQFSIPGETGVVLNGINPAGTAFAGVYDGAEGDVGFVVQNGEIRTLMFPGSFATIATGVNNFGQVVGYFWDRSLVYHGFVWTPPAGEHQ